MTQFTVTPAGQRAIIAVGDIPRKAVQAVKEELEETAIKIRNTIILSMQNTIKRGNSGDLRKTKKGLDGKRRKIHRPSMPGFPPAVDTGNLLRSIKMDVRSARGFEVEVGSDIKKPEYPTFLELGTDKMAARPWLKPAVESNTKDLEKRILAAIEKVS